MKKIIFASLMITLFSCKKNVITDNDPNSLIEAAQSINSIIPKTKFGSSIGGDFSADECVSIAKSLNVGYVRFSITMNEWTGKSFFYEAYTDAGINVILNVNNKPLRGTVPFPKDLTNYRKTFNSITNKYQPEVIVVENEEINPSWHKGPMSDYINMLKVALDVCRPKGIKVTNGGIYGPQLEVLTYRYLQTKSQARADAFANNCMYSSQVKAAENPGSDKDLEKDIRQLDTLLNFYHNLDYINVHLYEIFNPDIQDQSRVKTATPFVVAGIQEYLKARTGRPVMTNETTPRNNTNPELVTSILNQYDQLNFPYVIWYSNDGMAGGESLYNLKTGQLYPNGMAFSRFNANY